MTSNRWDTKINLDSDAGPAGGGAVSIDIRPPTTDHEALIQAISIFNNSDGGARDAYAQLYDGTDTLRFDTVSVADGGHNQLLPHPIRIKYAAYLQVISSGWTDRTKCIVSWTTETFSK